MSRLAGRRGVRHVAVGAAPMDGSWEWVDATGSAGPAGEPMRAETPWMIASVTKLFIATVVLRLHERGQVRLDAPLADVLPDEFRQGVHRHGGVDHTGELTLVHLLGHLSGLPDYLDQKPRGGRSWMDEIVAGPDRRWSSEDAVRHARERLATHFPPSDPAATRARIRYSDTNFQLLVVAAQHVTGRSIDELFAELVFEPAGLGHTWLPGRSAPTGVAPATAWLGDRPFDDRPEAMASFGDLYCTTSDLLRFGRHLLSGELFDEPATLDRMSGRFRRFGFPRSVSTLRAPGWPIEYGLGLMRFRVGRVLGGGRRIPTVVGHTGSTGSWLWHVPELDLVVAGTVDQATAAAVPFQAVPRALASLRS